MPAATAGDGKSAKELKRSKRIEKRKQYKRRPKSFDEGQVKEVRDYLLAWSKHDRDATVPWKFSTKLQRRLLGLALTEELSKNTFGVACRYLQGCKGQDRETAVEAAREAIATFDQAPDDAKDDLRKQHRRATKLLTELGEFE